MKLENRRGFASDNNAGIHPAVLQAIVEANVGHTVAYGDDPLTADAVARLQAHLGNHAAVFFVYNGTAANVLGLKAATQPYHAVICAETAHIQVDECGAPENFTGCKLLSLPGIDGKISPADIRRHLHGFGFEHHAQPKVVSITQATELGTLYTVEEIRAIAELAHHHGLYLHMDGARLANAAVALNVDLKALTADAGVDILSFGGTKNGMMVGEALVFFEPELTANFKYTRKQGMQLNSKMRFVAAQFNALLENDLWARNARRANDMAALLAEELKQCPQIEITRPVQTNAVFARMPRRHIERLTREFFFYVWNEETSEVRWMTAFDTTPEDVCAFVAAIQHVLGATGP